MDEEEIISDLNNLDSLDLATTKSHIENPPVYDKARHPYMHGEWNRSGVSQGYTEEEGVLTYEQSRQAKALMDKYYLQVGAYSPTIAGQAIGTIHLYNWLTRDFW